MRRLLAVSFGLALSIVPTAQAAVTNQDDKDLAEIGDYVQIALPLAGYVGAWVAGDKEGAFQLTKSLASAGITAHFFKAIAERTRPDASDSRSFPSGHTTAAFAGSEFIRQRYGNAWGIPATIAAAFVGYTRIRANKHFRDDVLAGMSNGLMWNWYYVSPYSEVVDLRPTRIEDGWGFEFNYNFDGQLRDRPVWQGRPRFRYNLEWGPVTQDKNIFQAPRDDGTPLDLATAENEYDFTSRVTFTHYFDKRHEWSAFLAPMELIEFEPSEIISEPINFNGVTFAPTADSSFEARYSFVEFRLAYRYSVLHTERIKLKLGVGAQYGETALDFTQFRGSPKDNDIIAASRANVDQIKLLASVHADIALSDRWRIDAQYDGVPGGSEFYHNAAVNFVWAAAPGWDLGFGARYVDRRVDEGNVRNELQHGDVTLSVSHYFY